MSSENSPMHRAVAPYQRPPRSDARSELILEHRELLDRCARRLVQRTGAHAHFDDLWNAGALGLLEAAQRFDATQGAQFSTFAEHRVRGAMLDELRRIDHLPRRLRRQADAVAKTRAQLHGELGRDPDREEIASSLGIGLDAVEAAETLAQPHASLDDLAHLLGVSPGGPDLVDRRERVVLLAQAVASLSERLQLVLALRYTEGLTTREIARILDVSEPRVSQLHGDAIAQLRVLLHGADGPDATT